MHAIQDRPIARNGQVVIRPMMYIALTYDHRIVDGREAVGFVKRIKEVIEEPSRMLMEIQQFPACDIIPKNAACNELRLRNRMDDSSYCTNVAY